MQSSSLKLFSSFEQKAMLLKRQAFAVFSGELDQYHLYLPLIPGKKAHPPPQAPSPNRQAQSGQNGWRPGGPTAHSGKMGQC